MPAPSPVPNKPVFEAAPPTEVRNVLTPALIVGGLRRGWALGVTLVAAFLTLGFFYVAFMHHAPYVATAVIEPPIAAGPQMSGAGQMLASLAGVEANAGSAQFTKYLQVIGSTRFAEQMDKDHGVLRILFPGWDPVTRSWHKPHGAMADLRAKFKAALGLPAWTPPDTSKLAAELQYMTSITLVPGKSPLDLRSQVFSVSVKAKSRDLALNLLTWSLRAADDIVREDQLARTTNRIAYLKAQIDSTQEVYLRSSLQTILMAQEETLMTLHADRYYALDVIDKPSVSDTPVGTSATTILAVFAAMGFVLYLGIVVWVMFARVRNPRLFGADPLRKPFPNPVGMVFGRLKTATS